MIINGVTILLRGLFCRLSLFSLCRSDPVVRFQRRFYRPLVFLLWLVLPVTVSVVLLEESLTTSLLVNVWRYVVSLHNTWLVNSLAHLHGTRPYNRNIEPRENRLVVRAPEC